MKIEKKLLLHKHDIVELLKNGSSQCMAEIVYHKLKSICVISNNIIYILSEDKHYIYEEYTNIDFELVCLAGLLIDRSIKNLSNKVNDSLKEYKTYKTIQKHNNIRGYVSALRKLLTNDKITFNLTKGQIHFKNGFVDVKTKEFKPRTNEDYITKYIDRDYRIPEKNEIKE